MQRFSSQHPIFFIVNRKWHGINSEPHNLQLWICIRFQPFLSFGFVPSQKYINTDDEGLKAQDFMLSPPTW